VLEFSQVFREKRGEMAAREYVQHLADDLNGRFNHLVEDVQVMVDKILSYFGARKKKENLHEMDNPISCPRGPSGLPVADHPVCRLGRRIHFRAKEQGVGRRRKDRGDSL
jgi:hypothetical protein